MPNIASAKLYYGIPFEWDISTDTVPGLPWDLGGDLEEWDGTSWWEGLPDESLEKPFTCETFGQANHRACILTSPHYPGFCVEWGTLKLDPAILLNLPSDPVFEAFAQKYFPDRELAWYLCAVAT